MKANTRSPSSLRTPISTGFNIVMDFGSCDLKVINAIESLGWNDEKKCYLNYLLILLMAVVLAGCSDSPMVVLGPQQWEDLEFRVEVHPSPPSVGMTEFIVIASRDVYKPGVGLVVDIRVDETGKWRQAIQDGFTGVYRRAVFIRDPKTQSLHVNVRRSTNDDKVSLSFPLNQVMAAPQQ